MPSVPGLAPASLTVSPLTVSPLAADLPSFFISSTSDLKMRIERPMERAASGSRLKPKSTTRRTSKMMRCQPSNSPRMVTQFLSATR